MKSTILNISVAKYCIAGVIILLLPMFYIFFNIATPRYIYFPHFHIYAATACLLLLALSLIFYPRYISIVSATAILLLSSWAIQNVVFSTYYLWLPSLKSEKWQPLLFWESLTTAILGGEANGVDPSYWLVVVIPLGVCVFLLLLSGKINKASNQPLNSMPRNGAN